MRQRGFLTGGLLYVVLGLGAATLLAGGWGWIQSSRLKNCQTEFAAFKLETKMLGEAADLKRKQIEADNLKAKEKADADYKRLVADRQSLDKRLRDERARSRALSKIATRAPSPERTCLRGPIIDAAVARLIEDVSGATERLDAELSAIVREGEAARIGLNNAKAWAQSLKE